MCAQISGRCLLRFWALDGAEVAFPPSVESVAVQSRPIRLLLHQTPSNCTNQLMANNKRTELTDADASILRQRRSSIDFADVLLLPLLLLLLLLRPSSTDRWRNLNFDLCGIRGGKDRQRNRKKMKEEEEEEEEEVVT